MALVKCKECGEKVSTKAKACPKCGAKSPKKTSVVTWLVLVLIVAGVYGVSQSPNYPNSSENKKDVSAGQNAKIASKVKPTPKPKPAWRSFTSKDEMTGKLQAFAHSPQTYPTRRMEFPYDGVEAWIGAGCDGKSEWVYIGFNSAPNLANDETEDGYSLISTRIKWDDSLENVKLTQDWGAKFIHFREDSSALSKIAVSSKALLELQWHGEQPTYFEFSLNGSSKAIAEMRNKCKK
jgi:RNA polymerase subunit RPABC4/transcription elongation factor Spt4